jgi:hypothetical protein
MFVEGGEHCFIRLSNAKEMDPHHKESLPSLALKCMRNDRASANLVAMYGSTPQKSWNFFENDLSTMIERETNVDLLPLARKFNTATSYIDSVGLADWAWFSEKSKIW